MPLIHGRASVPASRNFCLLPTRSTGRSFSTGFDGFQFFPAQKKVFQICFRGGEIGDELVGLPGMGAMKVWRGKYVFEARDFRLSDMDRLFHALQFTRLFK